MLLAKSDALHASMSHITLLYLLSMHYMRSQCPRSILPTCNPSLLVKDVEHRYLRRPGDAYKLHVGQQESREHGVQRGMELSKRYPIAFSGAAAVMERATISSVVAHCQPVFEMEECGHVFTGLEGSCITDENTEFGHVLAAVAGINITL